MNDFRIEHDGLGELEVPVDAYWGVQTQRAVENYQITGFTIASFPALIEALAQIKKAAAWTNERLGLLDKDRAQSIIKACDDLIAGKLHNQFVVDIIQGGAGTSTNMNANEVICNRALEYMNCAKGDYTTLHPNTHVNMSQSTNDVYPTALRVAMIIKLRGLREAMEYAKIAFEQKAEEFKDIIKMGRTQLQDAVPMTLGQEFKAYAILIGEDIRRLGEVETLIDEINLVGTAIGTGLNAHPEYTDMVIGKLCELTGLELVKAENLVEATQDAGVYEQVSGIRKRGENQ